MDELEKSVWHVIARVPEWANASDLRVERIPVGMTARNFWIDAGGERFVLRVAAPYLQRLGINPRFECEATSAAARVGVGPDVLRFIEPEGHMVLRYLEGREWSPEEFQRLETLPRIVETLKKVHALTQLQAAYSPFAGVRRWIERARAAGDGLPADMDRLLRRMGEIESLARADSTPHGLCHNDLFRPNFMDQGDRVRILDWEYAGVGDIYFDLGTLIVTMRVAEEHERELLRLYFGEATAARMERLRGMEYMLHFREAMWALTIREVSDKNNDFRRGAERHFDWLREHMGT